MPTSSGPSFLYSVDGDLRSSETSINVYKTTLLCIPKYCILYEIYNVRAETGTFELKEDIVLSDSTYYVHGKCVQCHLYGLIGSYIQNRKMK
jgi:hypothetical protein